MRYGSRLKCVNVGSHIWRKEEEKKHKLTIFESEKIFFTFLHFLTIRTNTLLFSQISNFEHHKNTEIRKSSDDNRHISA